MRLLFAFLISITSLANAINVPKHTGYVNDYANLLSVDQKNDLEQRLRQNFNAGGWQIAVVTVPDLQGESVEEFAYALFNTWGIGRKGKDDGVLIIQSVNPRQIRIEVGRGNEGDLPDISCARIIRNHIVPELKRGNNYQGLLNGVLSVIEAKPRELTEAEKAEQARVTAEQARVAEANRLEQIRLDKERKYEEVRRQWKEEQDANVAKMEKEKSWNAFKAKVKTILLVILFTFPIWVFPAYRLALKLRDKYLERQERLRIQREKEEAERKERERLEAIEEEKRRKREIEVRKRREEAERIAAEKERQWRLAHPAEAREKDRLAALAAAALLVRQREEEAREAERRRKRRREEEEEAARRRRNNSSGGGFGGFGGFGGGRSSGGGASSGY